MRKTKNVVWGDQSGLSGSDLRSCEHTTSHSHPQACSSLASSQATHVVDLRLGRDEPGEVVVLPAIPLPQCTGCQQWTRAASCPWCRWGRDRVDCSCHLQSRNFASSPISSINCLEGKGRIKVFEDYGLNRPSPSSEHLGQQQSLSAKKKSAF